MINYGELKRQLRSVLWPSPTEARNLREAHDIFFKEAMVELSKWIPCLRVNNSSVFEACSTYVQCAKSIVSAPTGKVKRVYTVANSQWCDQVFYRPRSFPELEAFARKASIGFETPENAGMDQLPLGVKYHEASVDSECGRARIGIYAIHNRRLYLAPWIQSNETIVVEWDGWKRDWNDKDQIDDNDWDEQVQAAIRAYVKWKHEVYYGCDPVKKKDLAKEYETARAEVAYWCEQKNRPDEDEVLPDDRSATPAEVKDDAVAEPDSETIFFANIGDFGSLGDMPAVLNVADLVKSKNPDFIITNGDNDYDGDYDATVGQFYHEFLFPYTGAFGSGATEQRMFPVPGNHDWDYDDTLDAYKTFFSQTENYYELVKGPAHFFFLDSDSREPAGATSTGKQAQWLQAKLALSPAKWKIVILHHAPYTSNDDDTPGITRMRWPFKTWGADLVLCGHAHGYERIEVDEFPYIVNGAGGRSLDTFVTPVAGSQVREASFGAGFCTIDCTKLTYQFFKRDGTLVDTFEIEK